MTRPSPPPELEKFAGYFVDIERNAFPPALDRLIQFALGYLTPDEKRGLAAFLDQCAAGAYTEKEMWTMWTNSGPRHGVEPASYLFGEVRAALGAQGYT